MNSNAVNMGDDGSKKTGGRKWGWKKKVGMEGRMKLKEMCKYKGGKTMPKTDEEDLNIWLLTAPCHTYILFIMSKRVSEVFF